MDQCTHCTVRGDEKACRETPCNLHESWMVESIRAQLAEAKAEIQEQAAMVAAAERDELFKAWKKRDELLWALELLVEGIDGSVSDTYIPLVKARDAIARAREDMQEEEK